MIFNNRNKNDSYSKKSNYTGARFRQKMSYNSNKLCSGCSEIASIFIAVCAYQESVRATFDQYSRCTRLRYLSGTPEPPPHRHKKSPLTVRPAGLARADSRSE